MEIEYDYFLNYPSLVVKGVDFIETFWCEVYTNNVGRPILTVLSDDYGENFVLRNKEELDE